MSTPYEQEIDAWQRARVERLRSPEGWLSLVGLWWLHPGTNTIGSAEGNDVVLPSREIAAEAGTIELGPDGRAVLHADPAAGFRHRSQPVTTLEMRADPAEGLTRIRAGSISFHLIRREDMLAVRVRDRDRPARVGFDGIRCYPIDPAWRVDARLEPDPDRREVIVPAVAGPGERYVIAGTAAFEAPNAPGEHRLIAFEEKPGEDLFFVFGDATNVAETYPGGRFMYMPPPAPDDAEGRMVLDFNQAYNPPCVFTEFATCPVPLPANRLKFRIEAGELRYGAGSTGGDSRPNPSG